jgi:hypothetical protein
MSLSKSLAQLKDGPVIDKMYAVPAPGASGASSSGVSGAAGAALATLEVACESPLLVTRIPGEGPLNMPIPPPWSLLRPPRSI